VWAALTIVSVIRVLDRIGVPKHLTALALLTAYSMFFSVLSVATFRDASWARWFIGIFSIVAAWQLLNTFASLDILGLAQLCLFISAAVLAARIEIIRLNSRYGQRVAAGRTEDS
jgi:hypothetical protein